MYISFTYFHNAYKIAYEDIMSLTKLGQTLNTFKQLDYASQTQKGLNITQ
jgi:hypothetical protein